MTDDLKIKYLVTGEKKYLEEAISLDSALKNLTEKELETESIELLTEHANWRHHEIATFQYATYIELLYLFEYNTRLSEGRIRPRWLDARLLDKIIKIAKESDYGLDDIFEEVLECRGDLLILEDPILTFTNAIQLQDKHDLFMFGAALIGYNITHAHCLLMLSKKYGFKHSKSSIEELSDDTYESGLLDYVEVIKENARINAELEKAKLHILQLQSLPGGEIYEAAKKRSFMNSASLMMIQMNNFLITH